MRAETAYNVIKELSEKETSRLYDMLGISQNKSKPVKRNKMITDAEATEYLLTKLKGVKRN
ncbi:hypothetical protein [Joostella sp.]|uniref:hypothetical protein n=1 Tax=Joostella sp. TaxID=2231138 RepID=UPI003A9505B5